MLQPIVIVILLLCSIVNSQQIPDSVLKRITSVPVDRQDDAYLSLSMNEVDINPQLGIEYALKGLTIAEARNDDTIKASLLSALGQNYCTLGKYSEAMQSFGLALQIAEKEGNKKAISYTVNNLANIYTEIDAWDKALELYLRALKIAEEIKDSNAIAGLYSNIGGIYGNVDNSAKEIEFYRKALVLNYKRNNKPANGIIYANMASAFLIAGDTVASRKAVDSAIILYKLAEDSVGLAEAYGNLGELLTLQKKYSDALKNLNVSIQIVKSTGDAKTASESYLRLGKVLTLTGSVLAAKEAVLSSYRASVAIEYLPLQKETIRLLVDLYEQTGKKDSAFLLSKQLITISDSLNTVNNNKHLNNLLTKYEVQQKEQEIFKLLGEKEFLSLKISEWKSTFFVAVIVAIIILIAFLATLSFYKEKSRLTIALAENNKKLIDSQLQLQQALKDKDKFISILAHDLRNPFNAMLPFIDELRDDDSLDPHDRRILTEQLHRLINSTYQMLNNLLLWAGTQSGKMSLNPEEFSLTMITDAVQESVLSQANAKNINLGIHLKGNSTVYGDIETVNIILRNLAGNAVKFTNENGSVAILGEEAGEYYKVSVTDTGIGMSEQMLRIIQGSTSVHSTTGTRGERGSGIGLTLVKEFVALNKGNFSVTSEQGKGSVFTFTLPRQAK